MHDPNRIETENWLLTLASRLNKVESVVVVVAEEDGRFTHHQANYGDMSWVTMVGNLTAIQHDILTNKVSWAPVNSDGTEQDDET